MPARHPERFHSHSESFDNTCDAQVGALLGLILLRWVVAGASWAAAGRAIWVLPNLLSEVRVPQPPLCEQSHACFEDQHAATGTHIASPVLACAAVTGRCSTLGGGARGNAQPRSLR